MRIPVATYRIQFNADFTFNHARKIADYLAQLGVSELYASPIFAATTGSTHGYDVVNPNQLNPELGTQEDFEALVSALQKHQMGWLQDIVPNHMAYNGQNQWLMDVLENGPSSRYVEYFDLAWNAPFEATQDPILVPLLGDFYGACLENGEIQLQFDERGLSVNYYSLKIPLRLESYATFLTQNLGQLTRTLGRKHPYFIRLLGILYILKNLSSDVAGQQREDQADFVKGMLWELYNDSPEIKNFIDENIQIFNGEKGNPASFNLLDALLSDQFFRLSYWKVGAEEINYRRFFTVNELISVKVENLKVFNQTHDLICRLVQEGKFTGLRIDHIDGLFDPTEYLERLQEKTDDTYITVEKILQPGENLPSVWQMQGTSGYDYMNFINGIFCQMDSQERFDQIYFDITGNDTPFEELVAEKKHLIIDKNLAGDIDNLAVSMKKIASKYRYGNDFTVNGLKRALAEVLTRFPIYRTYTNANGVLEGDRVYIETVIQTAKEHTTLLQNELNFIEKLLLLQYDDILTQAEKDQWLYLVMRIQQYTGPLMAKGVEDTVLYVYNRLLALNEVGGNPERFGIPLSEFHEFNRVRQEQWFNAMSATATHDTKRGEDVRARLNVLSEVPDEWHQHVRRWSEMNRTHKTKLKGAAMPDRNDEYAFYQTLIGAFPFTSGLSFDETEYNTFVNRVKDYMLKAIRESKVYTAWLRQNSTYEEACTNFVKTVLDNPEQNIFLEDFLPFQQRIAFYGIFNSLSQTLIKITSPGIPDFYQGTELWDFSLVDPDNRRPVDFEQRQTYLTDIQARIDADLSGLLVDLLANQEDGRIKLFLTVQALKARTQYLDVFQCGDYHALPATGKFKEHVIGFARSTKTTTIIAIAPRFLTGVIQPGEQPLGQQVWGDTCLQVPNKGVSTWRNLLTQETMQANGAMSVGQALHSFPVALFVSGSH